VKVVKTMELKRWRPPLTAEEMLKYADRLACRIRHTTLEDGLSEEDGLVALAVAFRLAQGIYPRPDRVFPLLMEAEGTLDLMLAYDGEPC